MLKRLELTSLRKDGFDYYQTSRGRCYPSVTTILNATAKGKNQVLEAWRARIGEYEAIQIREEALQRGMLLHKRIAAYLSQQKLEPCPDTIKPWRDSVKHILRQLSLPDSIQLVEGVVIHPELKYAGRLDCILKWKNSWCIVDWKTATTVPKERWLYRYKLQLAAYLGAANRTYIKNKTYNSLSIKQGLLIVAIPNRPAKTLLIDSWELERYFLDWVIRVRHYRKLMGEDYAIPINWKKLFIPNHRISDFGIEPQYLDDGFYYDRWY